MEIMGIDPADRPDETAITLHVHEDLAASEILAPDPEDDPEPETKCSECGAIDTTSVAYDGSRIEVCESCRSNLTYCARCEEYCSESHYVAQPHSFYSGRGSRSETWCEGCSDSHAFRCRNCLEWFSDNCNYMVYDGDRLCQNCMEEYDTCDDCGDTCHNDDLYYNERHEESYCSSCRSGHSEKSESVHEYDYKPRAVFHGNPKQVHFGVELEVTTDPSGTAEGTLERLGGDGENHVYLKSDSTIEDDGYEIVTHPHTLEAHRKLWDGWFRYADRQGIEANGNGMHVHIERKGISGYRSGMMQAFLNAPDNKEFVVKIAGRNSYEYAEIKPELEKVSASGDNDRYQALNLCNSRTLEIRIFRGTVVKSRFFANLEFCAALTEFTICRSHQDLTVPSFCQLVRNSRKTWPNLDEFLVTNGYLKAVKKNPKLQEKASCV